MSGVPMMELNAKNSFLWDWENIAAETQKKFQFTDSEIDGMEGFEIASLYSSGCAGSDMGYASSSKSSKSTSVDFSVDREVKEGTQFTMGTSVGFQEDVRNKRELIDSGSERTSSIMGSSAGSGESLIALELGERRFFEDVSAGSNAKNSSLPPNYTAKRSKSSSLNVGIPQCQVEGCNLDLSSAKDYHRKHRVCENHSKSPKVVINGVERRFCQQCSRFHGLSEFDQKKRSCRRRLSDHNARRRKPKPEVIQFNSMGLPQSLYEGGNQLSFAFGQMPVHQTRHDAWEDGTDSKPCLFTSVKSGNTNELQNGIQNPENKLSRGSTTHLLSFQGASSPSQPVFQRGLPVSVEVSNMDGAQDFRALSLLSTTNTTNSYDLQPSFLNHPISMLHALPLGGPPECWLADEHASSSSAHESNTSTFQFFKAHDQPPFYLY